MSSVITLIVVTFVMRLIVLVCLFALACAAPPVLVQFYEESGCPDCQDFISGTLNTTLTNPALAAIINLQVFPWGNAYHQIAACPPAGPGYDRSGRFCWVTNCAPNVTNAPADCYLPTNVICQHGDVECAGNNVEMCVVNSYPTTEHQIAVARYQFWLISFVSNPISIVVILNFIAMYFSFSFPVLCTAWRSRMDLI
jgi:thiol-disulfide isomerase/thioredoxin